MTLMIFDSQEFIVVLEKCLFHSFFLQNKFKATFSTKLKTQTEVFSSLRFAQDRVDSQLSMVSVILLVFARPQSSSLASASSK